MIAALLKIIKESIRAVPAMKYALAVVGIVAVVGMVRAFNLSPAVAVFGAVITLVLMVAMVIFARLTTAAPKHFLLPAQVMMWSFLALSIATASLLFTCAFFKWPRPVDELITTHRATSDNDAKKAQVLTAGARIQLKAYDYAGAWKSVEQAITLAPGSEEAREEQVEVAMAWLRQLFDTPQTGGDKLDDLTACLRTAALKTKGARAADIHAHIGWGNFLKRSEDAQVEEEFKLAVALDLRNPFAQAMWGYWLVTTARQPNEGKTRFRSASQSGQQKEFVRRLQLAAWRRYHDNEGRLELILVVDDMRRQKETPSLEFKDRLFSDIYANPDVEFLRKYLTILPAADHLATFLWLTKGMRRENNTTREFFLAHLTEAAGDSAAALSLYRALLAQPTRFERQVREGIERTKSHIAPGISETSGLLEQAKSGDAATRAKLIRSFARADIDVAEVLPAVVSWVQDADREIRAAACETLVQFGRVAVSYVVPLLSSPDRRDVLNAAGILAQIHLEQNLAVPALGKALNHPDAEVRGKVVNALASFGPDAEPAVPVLVEALTKTVQKDLQKQIAYALGEIGPGAKEAVPQLINLVKSGKDPEGFLNVVAAEALGKMGAAAATAVPALAAALRSDDVRLPTVAAEALGSIGAEAKDAIPALIEAMKVTEKEHRDNYAEPLGKIAEALANKGDTESLPVLRKAMQSLELANVEPKFITPVREALEALKEKEARRTRKSD
ncbi:MAG: HEAT repeat domain-containing protein [Verrucomicrobiota bacterium]